MCIKSLLLQLHRVATVNYKKLTEVPVWKAFVTNKFCIKEYKCNKSWMVNCWWIMIILDSFMDDQRDFL